MAPTARRIEVFAVEDTTAQVCWAALAPGAHTFSAGDTSVEIEGDGGPGAVVLEDLPPATTLDLLHRGPDGPVGRVGALRTLEPPPGALLTRLCTLNDVHLGGTKFGVVPRRMDPAHDDLGHARLCADAAVAAARAWGAELLVVKGDLTHGGQPDEWEEAGAFLASAGMAVEVVPGNHDSYGDLEAGTTILARHGISLTLDVTSVDLPGIRVVCLDTTVPGRGLGRVAHHEERVCEALAGAGGPALLAKHHHLQRHTVATFWPPGIPGPESDRFLRQVAAANPSTLVATGHTHRHRRHVRHGLTVAEVGSPKDYPGTWTGYAVHEGGIRQVTRRVSDPDAMRWTDATRVSYYGLWGRWSAGTIDQRCFTTAWDR